MSRKVSSRLLSKNELKFLELETCTTCQGVHLPVKNCDLPPPPTSKNKKIKDKEVAKPTATAVMSEDGGTKVLGGTSKRSVCGTEDKPLDVTMTMRTKKSPDEQSERRRRRSPSSSSEDDSSEDSSTDSSYSCYREKSRQTRKRKKSKRRRRRSPSSSSEDDSSEDSCYRKKSRQTKKHKKSKRSKYRDPYKRVADPDTFLLLVQEIDLIMKKNQCSLSKATKRLGKNKRVLYRFKFIHHLYVTNPVLFKMFMQDYRSTPTNLEDLNKTCQKACNKEDVQQAKDDGAILF